MRNICYLRLTKGERGACTKPLQWHSSQTTTHLGSSFSCDIRFLACSYSLLSFYSQQPELWYRQVPIAVALSAQLLKFHWGMQQACNVPSLLSFRYCRFPCVRALCIVMYVRSFCSPFTFCLPYLLSASALIQLIILFCTLAFVIEERSVNSKKTDVTVMYVITLTLRSAHCFFVEPRSWKYMLFPQWS